MDRIRGLSEDALHRLLLDKGLSHELADKLKDEAINGSAFCSIDASMLRVCGFKTGEIIEILKYSPSNFDYSNKRPHDTVSSDSGSDSEKREEASANSVLSPYFSDEDLGQMGLYEKKAFVNQLEKWELCKSQGFGRADMAKPSFVKDHEKKAKKSTRKGSENVTPTRTLGMTSNSSSSVCNIEDGEDIVDSFSRNKAACDNLSKASSVAANTAGASTAKSGQTRANINTGGSSKKILGESSGNNSRTVAPPSSRITDERLAEISKLKIDLPTVDVLKILSDEDLDETIQAAVVKLKQGKLLPSKERKLIIRILTKHLHFSVASSPKDVTTSMKEGLAKSFVIAFPQYVAEDLGDGNILPWAFVYNKTLNTGYIANASRSIQKKNRKRDSKKKKSKLSSSNALSGEDSSASGDSEEVLYLGQLNAGRVERTEILDGMARTHSKRNKDRENGLSITEMLKKYPHFVHYDGEVLREEFKRMFPKSEDVTRNMMKYMPNILKLPATKEVNVNCNEDILRALVLISQNLPHDVRKAGRRDIPGAAKMSDLVCVVSNNESIDQFIEDHADAAQGPVQPYLIFVTVPPSSRAVRYFLVLDRTGMQIAGGSSVRALEYLLQSY
ncbi:Myopalladin, partial [Frankliniella fusca]